MSESARKEVSVPLLVGISKAIREVIRLADNVAQSDCCVLIEGDSGTGKELLARRIWAKSPRKLRPLIPVNCAGISETLFESQFFGHVRGAFTGAEQNMLGVVRTADGGTVFLDEISEISVRLQPKLLRVLQEQEVMPVGKPIPIKVDTRFIVGTNRNLREMVNRGEFRQDLYYRMNIVRIVIPPLRQRAEDVPPLLEHFSELHAARYKRAKIGISDDVRFFLTGYSWPGNVRELAAWVERLYATGLKPEVLTEMLLAEAGSAPPSTSDEATSLKEVERLAIIHALEHADHNQRKAARMLQIHRATLARKLKKYDLK
ncbi:MAG: sigma-54-dependent Fis family transcriptional regulator [Candidatus Nealsonbacteria bacterium]|nr:sigma-54-dependent Fis family transcriptional regulator [Candidatus Nealsonbacteria bacterium]